MITTIETTGLDGLVNLLTLSLSNAAIALSLIWVTWFVAKKHLNYDHRFDKMDARFEKVETQLEGVESRLTKFENKLDRVVTNVDRIEEKIDRLDMKFDLLISLKGGKNPTEPDDHPHMTVT